MIRFFLIWLGIVINIISILLLTFADAKIKKKAVNSELNIQAAERLHRRCFLFVIIFALISSSILIYFFLPFIGENHYKFCLVLKVWTIAVTLLSLYDGLK